MGRQAISGLIWLVAIGVLARHLSPATFGVVALASVLLNFITLVAEGGVGAYVIYYRGEDWRTEAQAAFWLNFWLTVVQVVVACAAIPFVADFFPGEDLTQVFLALVAAFFIAQLIVVPEAIVQRDLRFSILAKRDITLTLMTAAISVALALQGFGVWSLVLPRLLVEPVRLVVVFLMAQWNPGAGFHVDRWRRTMRYAAPLMGTNILRLLSNDGDTLVVGRVLGGHALGYYNLAWQLSNFVGRNISSVVATVAMPALSLTANDPVRTRRGYKRMIQLLAALSFPTLIGMFVLADDLVEFVYGPGWQPVVVVLRIFIAFTLVRSVTSPIGTVFNAVGRPQIGLKLTAYTLPFYFVAIIIGSPYGVEGVAIGVATVRIVGGIVGATLVNRLLGTTQRDGFGVFLPPLFSATVMGLGVWCLRVLLGNALPIGVGLAICVSFGVVFYFGCLLLLARSTFVALRRSVESVFPPVGALMLFAERKAGATAKARSSPSMDEEKI